MVRFQSGQYSIGSEGSEFATPSMAEHEEAICKTRMLCLKRLRMKENLVLEAVEDEG